MSLAKLNLVMLKKLLVIAMVMFAFGYAMIPFYKKICEVAGLDNLLQPDVLLEEKQKIDTTRLLTVELDANTRGLPWKFRPLQSTVKMHPGELVEVMYEIKNTTDREVTGQAIPSYAPLLVAQHIKKLECFCFTKQVLKPNEVRKMPVQFLIGTDFPKDIATLSISYTFFEIGLSNGKSLSLSENTVSKI
tara:strand:- start:546 stop:1115 length:570 start_codon:yes stop_codon:yes gene_type:complete